MLSTSWGVGVIQGGGVVGWQREVLEFTVVVLVVDFGENIDVILLHIRILICEGKERGKGAGI